MYAGHPAHTSICISNQLSQHNVVVLPVGPWGATVADNVCLKGGSAFLLPFFFFESSFDNQ